MVSADCRSSLPKEMRRALELADDWSDFNAERWKRLFLPCSGRQRPRFQQTSDPVFPGRCGRLCMVGASWLTIKEDQHSAGIAAVGKGRHTPCLERLWSQMGRHDRVARLATVLGATVGSAATAQWLKATDDLQQDWNIRPHGPKQLLTSDRVFPRNCRHCMEWKVADEGSVPKKLMPVVQKRTSRGL